MYSESCPEVCSLFFLYIGLISCTLQGCACDPPALVLHNHLQCGQILHEGQTAGAGEWPRVEWCHVQFKSRKRNFVVLCTSTNAHSGPVFCCVQGLIWEETRSGGGETHYPFIKLTFPCFIHFRFILCDHVKCMLSVNKCYNIPANLLDSFKKKILQSLGTF